ncbi:hypothetical protein D9M72_574300 [compost metagenome]
MTEAETGAELDAGIGIGEPLAHQVFAGDAEIDRAIAKFAGNLGGRQERDLHIIRTFDPAAIGAIVADGDDLHSGPLKDRRGVILHPPLGRQRDGDGH